MLVGCLGQLAGVCGFAVYLALAVSEHQGNSFSVLISTMSHSHPLFLARTVTADCQLKHFYLSHYYSHSRTSRPTSRGEGLDCLHFPLNRAKQSVKFSTSSQHPKWKKI